MCVIPEHPREVQAATNTAGVKQGVTFTYDPYGTTIAGNVDNMAGGIDNGGLTPRPIEHTTGLNPVIEMEPTLQPRPRPLPTSRPHRRRQ